MNVNVILDDRKYNLGRTMPATGLVDITAGDHYRYFFALDTSDVWTADGWLITAVQDDGVTCHVRKGTQVGAVTIQPETVLHYQPTAKSKHYLDQIAAA